MKKEGGRSEDERRGKDGQNHLPTVFPVFSIYLFGRAAGSPGSSSSSNSPNSVGVMKRIWHMGRETVDSSVEMCAWDLRVHEPWSHGIVE